MQKTDAETLTSVVVKGAMRGCTYFYISQYVMFIPGLISVSFLNKTSSVELEPHYHCCHMIRDVTTGFR